MDTGVSPNILFFRSCDGPDFCVDGSYSVGDAHGHEHTAGSVAGETSALLQRPRFSTEGVWAGRWRINFQYPQSVGLVHSASMDNQHEFGFNLSVASLMGQLIPWPVQACSHAWLPATAGLSSTINSPASTQLALAVAANAPR